TAFKWAFGHLLAASGLVDIVLALAALRANIVPGVPALDQIDPQCGPINVTREARQPRGDLALALSRGVGGTDRPRRACARPDRPAVRADHRDARSPAAARRYRAGTVARIWRHQRRVPAARQRTLV